MTTKNTQRPLIIGLTGGIGTGKSTAADILSKMGYPLHSADDAVHRLIDKKGAAVKPIRKLFAAAFVDGKVDRQILGQMVFGKSQKLKQLEKILHPLVQKEERTFVKKAMQKKAPAVILEIPLMFETGAEARCDFVICMTAPRALQKERVLKRKGMTASKFAAIIKHQMPESEKKKRADLVVSSEHGRAAVRRHLHFIMQQLLP